MNNSETEKKSPQPSQRKKKWPLWITIAILIVILLLIGRRIEYGSRKQALPPSAVPVYATETRVGDMKVFLNGLGSVIPINSVVLKSQVGGELMSVHFKEGQFVNKGDLLAEIDSRPFDAMIKQAEGQLVKDKALQDNAKAQYESYKQMVVKNAVDKLDYISKEASYYQAMGQVEYDQGVLDNAQLQLTYSKITAPLSGIAGFLSINPGNIVSADGSQGIATINQLDPIYVLFSLPEDDLQQILEKYQDGKNQISVDAYNRNDSKRIISGTLTSIDNQISSSTGTIQFKATFANPDSKLYPNQFVNAHLLLNIEKNVLIIPTAALQHGPQGDFVYVVNKDQTVSAKVVEHGHTEGDSMSIKKGLSQGDLVVIDGIERLREGTKVEVMQPRHSDNPSQG
ncbi:MAG TPA: multidrug transporter subunit MdtA [Lentisphaeria bacterium]|nr:MAG: hypothetical protein A2X47_11465 [Lentisphaerae bacterium GWF2_38_69]HBM16531.1 multidrug transporter subunit MdtA [Lentisphaeria bacterium]